MRHLASAGDAAAFAEMAGRTRPSLQALLAAAERVHVDGELLDSRGFELPGPYRHDARTSIGDRLHEVRFGAAPLEDPRGQVRRAQLEIALSIVAVASGAAPIAGEDSLTALGCRCVGRA